MIRFDRFSLKAKLVSAFVCVGIIPACVVGWRTFSATGALIDDIGKSYRTQAASIIDKMDRNLFERYGDVQAFGINDAVFDRSSWYQVGAAKNKIATVSNKYARLYGFYVLSMMVDTNGRVVAVNDRDPAGKPIDTAWLYQKNFAEASWFKDAMAGQFLSDAQSGLTGTVVEDVYADDDVKRVYGGDGLVLGYSAPVKDRDGHVMGVWNNRTVFSLAEEIVATAYQNAKAQGLGSMEIILIDRHGRVLIDYDPTRDGSDAFNRDPGIVLRLNLAETGVQAAQALVRGESGAGRAVHASKKIWQVTGYEASHGALGYPGLHWGVLLRIDEKQALASISAIRWQVIYVLLASVVALGGAAWFLGNTISRPLLGGIATLRTGVQQVTSAAGYVSGSAQSLSQGVTEQAASLEETSASMEEMASMTRKNAENATQASMLVTGVTKQMADSNAALGQMVASMTAIKESSNKVAKIIKTIDEIAFQTNILALNAAVEAARAGEAGMGFAVVADEVRNLAQRSAQAAKDTAGLIDESIARSQEGAANVAEVTTAIGTITESVARVKGIVDEVREASQQQTQGMDQVAQAIAQIEKVTQTAAATAEESAAASEELNAQAETSMAVIQRLGTLVSGGVSAPPVIEAAARRAPRPAAAM
ncbi:MAG TPA: methyl-accepting chemotaxis protein, partial [Vicinamibacterales bacterium]|nr:methyl-accepting chemotaxis protein [Vicinamibacterales bacterium]